MVQIHLGTRLVGPEHPPLVIAEVGINHQGSLERAMQMVDDAAAAGCECVKFQSHVIEDEMIPNDVVPGNADESIWDIMSRCALGAEEERELKAHVDERGLLFLCTPFSRAAAVRLQALGVEAFKIGSGECNNFPLIEHIARYGKPVLLSTGMNDLVSISTAVEILRNHQVSYALLHCTSVYPTPDRLTHLRAIPQMAAAFPDAVIGFSSHAASNLPCLGAVALGASILERHFVSDKTWPGPDVPISMSPAELQELITDSQALHRCLGDGKHVLPEEQPTIAFAYACVVTLREIGAGEPFTPDNIWVKRPGTGEIPAADYQSLLRCRAAVALPVNHQVRRQDVLG